MSQLRLTWFARAGAESKITAFGRTHAVDPPRGDLRIWRRAGLAVGHACPCRGGLSQPNHQDDRAPSGRGHHRFPRPAGREPLSGSTPDSFAAYVKTEVDRWAAIVRNSGA